MWDTVLPVAAAECQQAAEDIQSFLEHEDAVALAGDLAQSDLAAWLSWVAKNHATIDSFFFGSPAKRRKLFADPVRGRRLAFAALREARLVGAFLRSAEVQTPLAGSRDAVEWAGIGAYAVLRAGQWEWPFECPAPFSDWK